MSNLTEILSQLSPAQQRQIRVALNQREDKLMDRVAAHPTGEKAREDLEATEQILNALYVIRKG